MKLPRLLPVVVVCCATAVFAADLPNVIFILADDLGAHDVSCYGSTFYETPNIDRLAARGAKFTQAYAASPLCSPTRSSIQAGLYPARTGITAPACHEKEVRLEKKLAGGGRDSKVLNASSLTRLNTNYFTLAQTFHEAGYATAHFGKWHLGYNLKPEDRYEPRDRGFDLDFPHTPSAPGPGGGYLAPWKFINDPSITDAPGKHIEDRMSDEAAKFIAAHKDKPFYMDYWAFSVHSPWNARKDYIEHFKAKADDKNPQHNPLYAAMVRSLDDGVGRILAAVEAAGIADKTIIVFFSDNGGYSYLPKATDPEGFADQPATSNLPLRSGKASLYEGGTREPCIIVWPGKIKSGTVNETSLFQSLDFYPTLLSMCGLKPRTGVKLDGLDQTFMLLGKGEVRDRIFCHFPHGGDQQAQNMPGFKPGTYVRRGDWKLIRFFADNDDASDRFELYNLREDIGESNNVAAAHPDLVKELNALITEFLRDTEAVIPVRNPNFEKSGGEKKSADPLQGFKARGCEAAVKNGIVTVTGTSTEPFLGFGGGGKTGPHTLKFRARCASGGEGKVESLPSSQPGAPAKAKSVPVTLTGGDWREYTVDFSAKEPVSILRLHLPAQNQPVEIDWIELKAGKKSQRWNF